MGHRAGTDATRAVVRACGELGVKYLTVYVFSAENWGRPAIEVTLLMELLIEMTRKEIDNLNANNVSLHAIGELEKLPPKTRATLQEGILRTSTNTGLNLILALSYGGRAEIVRAAKQLAQDAATNPALLDTVDESVFSRYLYTSSIPDPELIIRTGGDKRISNFLLWQAAYSELYITDTLWPDFDKAALEQAINDFSMRERRFGKLKDEQ
jgi:undecaprenyl diphosphate synthase